MACIRKLSTRAKLLSGGYHLSITHIVNRQHHDTKLEPDRSPPGSNYLVPHRAFGFSVNRIRCFDSPLSPKFFGASFCRFLSIPATDGEDEKIKLMMEIARILNDTSVQVVSLHTPAADEVAVAAADSFGHVAFFQHFIDAVHSVTGFNWWASITLTTLMIKGAILPIQINGVKDCRKYLLLLPHAIKEIKRMEHMEFPDLFSLTDKDFKNLDELCSIIFRLLQGMLIRASFHICLFMGVLNMAEKVPSFKVGGVYWLLDLSTPDSYFVFPFLTAMIILLRTEGKAKHEIIKRFSAARKARNVWRSIAIISIPFTMFLPKAVFCYWITSELFSFTFAKAVKLYGVKKFYGFV